MEILGDLDFARLTGWEPLQGLTVSSAVRYRGGAGVNKWVGASRYFAPSNFQGGRLWRFLTAYLTYTTPQLFGVLNGLYFLAETGFTPRIGPAKLPGRYASGFVYFGVENKSFISHQTNDGRFAF